jgi:hypothetical protein
MEVDIEWSRENIVELAEHWQRAESLLRDIGEVTEWLEQDVQARFAQLVDAALGRDPALNYEQNRSLNACEITQQGVVAIPHGGPDSVALPMEVAG